MTISLSFLKSYFLFDFSNKQYANLDCHDLCMFLKLYLKILFRIKLDMTVYTDSLSNLQHYKNDFYKVAVTTYLSYHLQNKIDTWINDVAPSRVLFDQLEQDKVTWEEFIDLYQKEMNDSHAKSKIKWIRDFSKKNDVVLLCHESESDPCCHRHVLKKLIEGDT